LKDDYEEVPTGEMTMEEEEERLWACTWHFGGHGR